METISLVQVTGLGIWARKYKCEPQRCAPGFLSLSALIPTCGFVLLQDLEDWFAQRNVHPGVPLCGLRGSPAHGWCAGCGDGLSVLNGAVWVRQVEADPHLQGGPEVSGLLGAAGAGLPHIRWGPVSHLVPYFTVLLFLLPLTCFLEDYVCLPLAFPLSALAKILTFKRKSSAHLYFPFCPTYTSVLWARGKHQH